MIQKKKFIIPAAGYGRRVGSPPAKELLPAHDGRPLIESTLDHVRSTGVAAHIVTRFEKRELIHFIQNHSLMKKNLLSLQIIAATEEWPATVLASSPFWAEHNILILPDTLFHPHSLPQKMLQSESAVQAAVFDVEDFQSWGIVQNLSQNSFEVADKPWRSDFLKTDRRAWGLLGFGQREGISLFQAILDSNRMSRQVFTNRRQGISEFEGQDVTNFVSLPFSIELFHLETFQDLGRSLIKSTSE